MIDEDDKIQELRESILLREGEENGISDELKEDIYKLIDMSLERGHLYVALSSYMEIGDREGVKSVGERCIREGWYEDANIAFEYLNDRNGILKVIKEAEGKNNEAFQNALRSYMGSNTISKFGESFKQWSSEKGMGEVQGSGLMNVANMAYNLVDEYDMGIGIAKGGLYCTYMFNQFGLPTKIANCHRKGEGATFEWLDEINERDIEGKRIAVFDKDVVSGRTSIRSLEEIQKYNPKSVDLVLNYDPMEKFLPVIESLTSGTPQGYDASHYPGSFSYQSFDKVTEQLEQKLKY